MAGIVHLTNVATGDTLTEQMWDEAHDLSCFAEVSLADAATITPDLGEGFNFAVTLAGNRTLANPTNASSGQSGGIIVAQDATGGRTLAFGNKWKFEGGAAVGGVLSTVAGSVDVITYYVRANGTILAALVKDFKS